MQLELDFVDLLPVGEVVEYFDCDPVSVADALDHNEKMWARLDAMAYYGDEFDGWEAGALAYGRSDLFGASL